MPSTLMDEPNDRSRAELLNELKREIDSLKREMRGSLEERSSGVWGHIDKLQKQVQVLESKLLSDALEWDEHYREVLGTLSEMQTDRRVDKALQRGLVLGLTALGILSGVLMFVMYQILQ